MTTEKRDYTSIKKDCLLTELPLEEARYMAALQHYSSLKAQLSAARNSQAGRKKLKQIENEIWSARVVVRAQEKLVREYRGV